MAQPFRDIAQNLRTKPAIQWPGGNDIDRLYIVQDTVPVANFPEFPVVVESKSISAITPANGATVMANGTYAFGISGSWGSSFNVVVGASDPGANYIALPSGVTQSAVLTALMARMMKEYSVQPAVAANGGLAIWKTDGTTALTSAPSPFTLASTTASFLKTNLPDKYRRGSRHPRCQWLQLSSIEVLGRDDSDWNISIFYKVDRAKLGDAIGITDDSIASSFAGYEITEPYDSPAYPTVTWTFEILNPELHVRVPNKTPHPWIPQAGLVNEKRFEQDGVHLVTRVYMTLPGPVLETPVKDGSRLAKTLTKAVWTDSPGTAPAASGYTNLSEKASPDQQHPAVSLWEVDAEKFPGPVISSKKIEGTRELHTITRRFLESEATTAPSAPAGTIQVSKEPKATDNDLVRQWEVVCEKLPGPINYEPDEDGDQTIEIVRVRVENASPGAEPASSVNGAVKISSKLADTENDLIGEWQVKYAVPKPHAETAETLSGAAEGIQRRKSATSSTKAVATGVETSLSSTSEIRDKAGNTILWKTEAETVTAATGVIARQESATTRGTQVSQTTVADVTARPEHAAGQTSFSAAVSARNTAGTPIQWKSQAETLSIKTGLTDFDATYKPGYTLRKSTNIVETPSGESASDADYTYKAVERDLDGNTLAYEEQTTKSTATPRVAGTEKDVRPMVTLSTVERYDTDPNVTTPTGSSSLYYVDKTLAVYQLKETTATGRERAIGTTKQAGPGYVELTAESYSLNNSISTPQGAADIAYDDGAVTVFKKQETTLQAAPMTAGTEKDVRPMVSISTVKRFDTSGVPATPTGSSRIAKTDGRVTIYEVSEQTSEGRERAIGTTKDARVGYRLETRESYSLNNTLATPTGDVSIAYDDGQTTVYKKAEVTAVPSPISFVSGKENKPMVSITTNTRFSTDPSVSVSGQSSVSFTDGTITIYRVDEPAAQARERTVGVSKDARVGYTLETTEKYSASNTLATGVGSVDIAYDDGNLTVYKKQEVTAKASSASFVSSKTRKLLTTTTVTSRYGTSPAGVSNIYNADAVYTDGATTIFRVDDHEIAANDPVVMDTIIHTTVPAVLRGLVLIPITGKLNSKGEKIPDKLCVFTDIQEGYTGSFPGRETKWFTKTAPTAGSFVPVQFRPASIAFDGVYVNLQIGDCLHGPITFTEIIGTNDPNYEPAVISHTWAQTGDYADIPSGYVPYRREVEIYEDGFLVTDQEVKYR